MQAKKALINALYQLIGNKVYLHDFEKIVNSLVIEGKDEETIYHLIRDLNNIKWQIKS